MRKQAPFVFFHLQKAFMTTANSKTPDQSNQSDAQKLRARLESLLQTEPFQLFQQGAVLHVWRNSTPHNYWLAPAEDRYEHLYHWEERSYPGPTFMEFAKPLNGGNESNERVSYASARFRGRDQGELVSQAWVFDAEKFALAMGTETSPV